MGTPLTARNDRGEDGEETLQLKELPDPRVVSMSELNKAVSDFEYRMKKQFRQLAEISAGSWANEFVERSHGRHP